MASSEFVVHRPSARLDRWVAAVTGYAQDGLPPGTHRGLPSPYVTLVVTLRGRLDVVAHVDPARAASSHVALVGGLHTRPVLLAHDGHQHGLQVSLTPSGAAAVLGVPAGELLAWDGDLADVLGGRADVLVERVRSAATWEQRFAAVEDVLAPSGDVRAAPAEVGRAWRLLAADPPSSVAAAARDVGWSVRLLEKRFRAHVGLTPKQVARVARFTRARRLLAAGGPDGSVAAVAAAAGYADQPHLSREFRDLAGVSPRRWLVEEFAYVHDAGAGRAAG